MGTRAEYTREEMIVRMGPRNAIGYPDITEYG